MRYADLLPDFAKRFKEYIEGRNEFRHTIHAPINQERIIVKAILCTLSKSERAKIDKECQTIFEQIKERE